MATIRRGVGFVPEFAGEPMGERIDFSFDADSGAAGVRLVESVREQGEGVRLEDAEVVISGGRGIGGAEGFELLRRLAGVLGGAVGASRPPCDMGWAPSTCQVGLTGKVVAPRLYVAVGISGAMQHTTGMAESQCVIAINKDDKAHIFEMADYGVLGDYREVLPSFTARLSELAGDTGKG
jgi:electron transfer flavoprotein alpha subunit